MMQTYFKLLAFGLMVCISGTFAGCSRYHNHKATNSVEKGDAALKSADYAKAEIEYKNALSRLPSNGAEWKDVYAKLAVLYHDQGKSDAVVWLRHAAEQNPDRVDLRILLGRNWLDVGFSSNAWHEASEALRLAPGDGAALLLMADTGQMPDRTQELLRSANSQARNSADYHLAAASFHLSQTNIPQAQAELNAALKADPRSSEVHLRLATLQLFQGDIGGAEKSLKAAADLAPIRSKARLSYADLMFRVGLREGSEERKQKAREILAEISGKAPDYVPAWLLRARIAGLERKTGEALRFSDEVMERDAGNVQAMIFKGEMLIEARDATNAVAHFERLRDVYRSMQSSAPGRSPSVSSSGPRSDPQMPPEVHFGLARAYVLANQVGKAVPHAESAAKAQPTVDKILLRDELYLRFRRAKEVVDSQEKLWSRLSTLPEQQKNSEEAKRLATRTRGLLAEAYAQDNQPDKALEHLTALQTELGPSPQISLRIGQMSLAKTNLAGARIAFGEVLRTDDTNHAAVEGLVAVDFAEQNYEAAFSRVQKLSEANPASTHFLMLLANLHLARGTFLSEQQAEAEVRRHVTQARAALWKACDLDSAMTGSPSFLPLGVLYERLGEWEAAREVYEKALSGPSRTAPVLNNLANVQVRLGELDLGLKTAEAANRSIEELISAGRDAVEKARLGPLQASIQDTLGWILSQRARRDGNGQEMGRALTLLRGTTPRFEGTASAGETLYHLGIVQYFSGDESAAQATLGRALPLLKNREQDVAATRRALAVLAIDPSQISAADEAPLREALANEPHDPVALRRIATIETSKGRVPEAARAYENALRMSQNARLMAQYSVFLDEHMNQPERALELAKSARTKSPDDLYVLKRLGKLLLKAGDAKWAAAVLEDCGRKAPEDALVQHDLAWARFGLGQFGGAEAAMRASIKASQGSEQAQVFVDLVQAARTGSTTEADEIARRTLAGDPNHGPALFVSALGQERQGAALESAAKYEHLLSRYPECFPAARRLALLYYSKLGEDQKAVGLINKLRENSQSDQELTRVLGVISYRRGDVTRAVQLLQAADVAKDPEATAVLQLALHKSGQAVNTEVLRKAVETGVSPAVAKEAEAVLKQIQTAKR